MTVLIVYGSVEGQTAKIASFVAQKLRDLGDTPVLFDTLDAQAPLPLDGVDGVILAAPVHERRHPAQFEDVVRQMALDLMSVGKVFDRWHLTFAEATRNFGFPAAARLERATRRRAHGRRDIPL